MEIKEIMVIGGELDILKDKLSLFIEEVQSEFGKRNTEQCDFAPYLLGFKTWLTEDEKKDLETIAKDYGLCDFIFLEARADSDFNAMNTNTVICYEKD